MSLPEIYNCPGTLSEGFSTYSRTCLKGLFNGRKVNHVLPYASPASNPETDEEFQENRKRMSISGVQEKFSVLLDKNKLRLVREGERGTYILKPKPIIGRNPDQMPANEHLTMQIARQVYKIETAENALIFFSDGEQAYITLRFDVAEDGSKLAQDDFASLAGRTPQTHGEHFKYLGSYLEIFQLMKTHLPAYRVEAPKLLRILLFNYLYSNGDAHFKNFSILETPLGDYRLSPAYDLLNSRIHINDTDFALDEGLFPGSSENESISSQFRMLAVEAEIPDKVSESIISSMLDKSEAVERMVMASFLKPDLKKRYLQSYLDRLENLKEG